MQTYLASAHAIIAQCPTSKSLSVSTPTSAAKGVQLKLSFQGGLVLQFQTVLFAFNLDAVSFFLFNLKMFCVNDVAYFRGDLSSCIHLWAKWIVFCFYLNTFIIYKSAWGIFCFVLLCPGYWWNSSLLKGSCYKNGVSEPLKLPFHCYKKVMQHNRSIVFVQSPRLLPGEAKAVCAWNK